MGVIPIPLIKLRFGTSIRRNDGNEKVPGPGTYRLKPTFADVPSYLLPNQDSSKYSV